MSLIMRVVSMLFGVLSTYTGLFALTHFNPPVHADPGGVNACYLTFAWMIVCGPFFVWASTWRLNR